MKLGAKFVDWKILSISRDDGGQSSTLIECSSNPTQVQFYKPHTEKHILNYRLGSLSVNPVLG